MTVSPHRQLGRGFRAKAPGAQTGGRLAVLFGLVSSLIGRLAQR